MSKVLPPLSPPDVMPARPRRVLARDLLQLPWDSRLLTRGRRGRPRLGRLATAALVLALAKAAAAQAPTQPDVSASFATPAGTQVSLWAESPLFYNPTAIDIDPQGRVWVTEAVNYRQWDGRNPGLHHDAGDRVMVVEDTDGDGVADKSTVFAQDKDLVSPLGICWLPDKVLVSCSPTVWAYYDDDHDLKADRKEVFLTGFGGPNHDHGAHSFSVGPDGRLYMALGNAGPHIVTDKSGWTLRSGSCYTGGGQFEAPNKPGLVSDDGRVYVGGLILRCNQDGTGLAVMAHNFRNPYEVAVDAFGDMWTFDNDDDGNQCCRATWVMEGGNYGYFSADGSRTWEADRRPGQSVQRAHWHQDDPGVCPTTLITGSGGPTGVCVYEGDALPEALRGALLCADAGRSCVYALRRVPDGAGFKLLPLDAAAGAPLVTGGPEGSEPLTGLLVSKPAKEGDESWHLFRPSDVCVAPDGSVIVADWFDPGVGGHRAQDQGAYGRLLRVAGAGKRGPLAEVADAADAVAAVDAAVTSPCIAVRAAAAATLHRGNESPTRRYWEISDSDRPASIRARAIWGISDPGREKVPQPAAAADPNLWTWTNYTGTTLVNEGQGRFAPDLNLVWLRARAACMDWLWGMWNVRGYTDAAIDRQFLLWMNPARSREFLPPSHEMESARDDLTVAVLPADRSALEAVGIAWDANEHRLSESRRIWPDPQVARSEQWNDLQVALAWRLHPDSLVPALAARTLSQTLDDAAREQSLTALAFCTSREAAESMLTLALAGPPDTRELAAWWVQHNDGNVWRDFGLAAHLGSQSPWTDDDIVWRSGPVTRGSVPVDVAVSGSRRIALVVTPADNGNGCDWADWIEPRITYERQDGDVHYLAASPPVWESATAEWGHVNVGQNCDGGPLSVDGQIFEHGLGTHARSEIVFTIPYCPGVKTSFVATAAVDDGGTGQPNAPTKVEFLVYADRAAERERQALLAKQHLDELFAALREPGKTLDQRTAAATSLALDPQGGARLVAEAQAGRLAALMADDARDELLETLAEAIFRNPDPGVRALASGSFERLGSPKLPPVAEIVALPGDRHAGAALFFGAARCSSCHAVNGRGGDVGPDLSQIRTKYGRAELLDSILNPSAAIGAGFESVTLTLKDGSVLAGLLQADGAQVLLKDGTGARHVIDAADIAERRASKLSLMPDDIAYTLAPQQLADLCAFLQHDPSTPPQLGPPIELWNGKDLAGWIGVPDTSAWSVRDVDGAPILHDEGQPIGYIRTERAFTSFELTVEWRFPDPQHPGNSGVLLRVQAPDKVWPRSIESQLNSGDAGDIWNIDAFGMDTDPARTDGRRIVKLLPSSEKPLGEWNTYRITLRDGDLTLEVNGQVQNRARWCEELPGAIALQSEGAPIEFRRVTVREIGE